MTQSTSILLRAIASALLFACAVVAAPSLPGRAQTAADLAEVELGRDADLLRDEIRVRPKDIDLADTVLVFTNSGPVRATARCVAFDRSGTPIGRARIKVPGDGLKYMTASDIANGRDFIGQVSCSTQQHLIPSAIFLGPQIENLNVRVTQHDVVTRIRFPLVATY